MTSGILKHPVRVADFILSLVLVSALGGLATVVFAQVIMRFVLNAPPFWTEELARFLLIWLTFIGAVAAHRDDTHISVTFLADLLGPARARWLHLLVHLIVLALLVVLTKAGLDITRLGKQPTPALGISMSYFYMALLIGTGLMIIVTLLRLAETVKQLARKVPA